MLNIILFGPPGSGKGTQAALLVAKYNLEHTSTGDLLRAERAAKTPLGLEANKYIEAGELVPDEVVIGMIRKKLAERADSVQGFIFDGFPRTVAQAEALEELVSDRGLKIDLLLSLRVPEEELVKRLLERGATSGRKDDSNESTIRNRVVVYETQTAPVADYYAKQDKLVTINGVGALDDINQALSKEIEALSSYTPTN
ncbi:MAG: adenylate kinase [Chitinophagales bacterium]